MARILWLVGTRYLSVHLRIICISGPLEHVWAPVSAIATIRWVRGLSSLGLYLNLAWDSNIRVTYTVKDGVGSGGPLLELASVPDEARHGLWLGRVGSTTPLQLFELAGHLAEIILVSLVVNKNESCFVTLLIDLLADTFSSFWQTLSTCFSNLQLKHLNLATRDPFISIDPPEWCEVLLHPLQVLAYCEGLIPWDHCFLSDLCTLNDAIGGISLWKWEVDLSMVSRLTNLSKFCSRVVKVAASTNSLLWCSISVRPAQQPCPWHSLFASRNCFHLGK